jgi:hypothetical protein
VAELLGRIRNWPARDHPKAASNHLCSTGCPNRLAGILHLRRRVATGMLSSVAAS